MICNLLIIWWCNIKGVISYQRNEQTILTITSELLQMKFIYLSLIVVLFASQSTFAQVASTTSNPEIILLTDIESNDDNWVFFQDEDEELFYIDFEALGNHAVDLKLKNKEAEVVLEESLIDVPMNTIYEINLKDLPKGTYTLEIRTYQDVIKKEVVR